MKNIVQNVELKFKMKKLILLLLFGIFFVSAVYADSCQIARPYYGSVNCKETGSWSNDILVSDNQEWTCDVENCKISGIDKDSVSCTGMGTTSGLTIKDSYGTKIITCDSTIHSLSSECQGSFPYEFTKGNKINVDFWCNFGSSPEGNPHVRIQYKTIALELHFDSAEGFISGTEFCNTNSVWSQYNGKQLQNNNILKTLSVSQDVGFSGGSGSETIPSSSNLLGTLEQKQLSVGQGYWFVSDWVTRPSIIAKDYQGMKVWCNPIDKSLTKFEQVNTNSNDCYLIPTTRLSQTFECCSSGECQGLYNDQAIQCTDDFKCGYTKSCSSDYDCGATSKTCESQEGKYHLVSSSCDKSKLDSYGNGKCMSKTEEVKCCSGNDGGLNSCSSGSYCDYTTGCKEVTHASNGELKTGVEAENIAAITGDSIKDQSLTNSGSGKMLFILLGLISIAGAIAAFFYFNKKEKGVNHSGNKCSHCGQGNKEGVKFCIGCGGKLTSIKSLVKCKKCGTENQKGKKFCINCGTKLK